MSLMVEKRAALLKKKYLKHTTKLLECKLQFKKEPISITEFAIKKVSIDNQLGKCCRATKSSSW